MGAGRSRRAHIAKREVIRAGDSRLGISLAGDGKKSRWRGWWRKSTGCDWRWTVASRYARQVAVARLIRGLVSGELLLPCA